MRERAELWRRLAAHHHIGTADALLEAACALERNAHHLEVAPPPAAAVARPPTKPA